MNDLVEPCTQCLRAREALEAFKEQMRQCDLHLFGFLIGDNSSAKKEPQRLQSQSLFLRCPICKDTEQVLTADGASFLKLLRLGIDGKNPEIPF